MREVGWQEYFLKLMGRLREETSIEHIGAVPYRPARESYPSACSLALRETQLDRQVSTGV